MGAAGFGAYGKIPSIGDFFRLDPPPGFVSVWDNWLQRCLVSGTHTYGGQWDALYMSVPIWRFCLSPGLAGASKIIGVLMPSVDRVGRRFPLTLMAPLNSAAPVLSDHFSNNDLFAQLEDIALVSLDDETGREGLAAALAGLDAPVAGAAVKVSQGADRMAIRQTGSEKDLLAAAAARSTPAHLASPSVWSAHIDGDQRMLVCEGLPEGPNMQALFDFDAAVWTEEAT